jgi:hypothetical protein
MASACIYLEVNFSVKAVGFLFYFGNYYISYTHCFLC